MSPFEYSEFVIFAHTLADTARDITLNYFRKSIAIDGKGDGSPVTIADVETESVIRQRITQRYPSHSIIGEEHDAKLGNSEYEWMIDPIDGTRSFISGYPLYGTLICLLKAGQPIVSLIDMPAQNERFYASANTATVYRKGQNEQVVKTSSCQKISDAVMYSTDYGMFTRQENAQGSPLRDAVSMVRYNGDCYLYAMLSAGWIEMVFEADLKVYDFMPLKLIVEQAGGIISDWQGKPLTKNSVGQVLATANAQLHQQALGVLTING